MNSKCSSNYLSLDPFCGGSSSCNQVGLVERRGAAHSRNGSYIRQSYFYIPGREPLVEH